MTTYDDIKAELKTELTANGGDLDSIRDNSGEWVDGYVPVYNNRIIQEWQEMPGDYDDRGALEMGVSDDAGIVQRMGADLYLYYSELVDLVLTDLEEELEEKEGEGE